MKAPSLPPGLTLSVSLPMHELNRLLQAIDDLHTQLCANQTAWEGEEDSVKEEHETLIQQNEWFISKYEELSK